MKKSKSKSNIDSKADVSNHVKALRQYAQTALASRAKGAQSPAYNNFVKELQSLRRKLENGHDAAAEFSLVCLIQALVSCAPNLKEGIHDAVLTTILGMGLWSCTKPVRGAVLDLTVELVVVSSAFIPNCMQVLIFNVLPPPGSPSLQPDERGESWAPPAVAIEVQEQVVHAMEKAIQLVPALPTRLLPMLVQNIPHKSRDRNTQCLYLRALVMLAEGKVGPAMRDGLLLGIVEHLLSIDADIKWQEIVDAPTVYDEEEGSSEDEQDDIFEIEGMSELDINDPALHQQHHADQLAALQDGFHDPAAFAAVTQQSHSLRRLQQQLSAANGSAVHAKGKRPPVDETADKLDSLMEMTFQHLQWRVNSGQLSSVWQTMLSAFERSLLHAHRCKFTQYLIFFLALKDPQRCCNSFSACLMSMLRDHRQPPITRSACSAYLASFLARCALAPKDLVVDVLSKLATVCQEYAANALKQQQGLNGRSSSSGGLVLLQGSSSAAGSSSSSSSAVLGNVQRHQAFYAMVQALLYLLCYHMQPLLCVQQQLEVQGQQEQPSPPPQQQQQQQLAEAVVQLVKEQVLPLLSHPLAPLAVCHQAVVHEFVQQALTLRLADATWEAAAIDAVAAHQAAVASANAASAAVVVGGDAAEGADGQAKGVLRPLEVFFPFDPYLLQRSSRFLQLATSYMNFSNGHPHVLGAATAAGAADDADVAGASSDEGSGSEDDSGSDGEGAADEQELLRRAAAAAGASPDGQQRRLRLREDGEVTEDDSGSDDSSSSTTSEDEGDQAGPDSSATATAADGPAGLSRAGSRRQRPGMVPVGLAAAAAVGGGPGGLSGPSPPADMMAMSLAAAPYLGGVSFSPGEAAMGVSPYGMSPNMAMPMSYTYEGQFMQNLPARS